MEIQTTDFDALDKEQMVVILDNYHEIPDNFTFNNYQYNFLRELGDTIGEQNSVLYGIIKTSIEGKTFKGINYVDLTNFDKNDYEDDPPVKEVLPIESINKYRDDNGQLEYFFLLEAIITGIIDLDKDYDSEALGKKKIMIETMINKRTGKPKKIENDIGKEGGGEGIGGKDGWKVKESIINEQRGGASIFRRRYRPQYDSTIQDERGLKRKIMFIVKKKQGNSYEKYFIKVAPFSKKKNIVGSGNPDVKNLKEIVITKPINHLIIGNYAYEARIYDKIKENFKDTSMFKNILEMKNWGFSKKDTYRSRDNSSQTGSGNKPCYFFNIDQEQPVIIKFKYFVEFDLSTGEPIMYNIIESLDYYDECDGYLVYLVTEFADGYSTPHQLYTDTNKIDSYNSDRLYTDYLFNIKDDIIEFLKIILPTLNTMYEKLKFTHNDLHGGNILLRHKRNSDYEIKLFDFDLSSLNTDQGISYSYWIEGTFIIERFLYEIKNFQSQGITIETNSGWDILEDKFMSCKYLKGPLGQCEMNGSCHIHGDYKKHDIIVSEILRCWDMFRLIFHNFGSYILPDFKFNYRYDNNKLIKAFNDFRQNPELRDLFPKFDAETFPCLINQKNRELITKNLRESVGAYSRGFRTKRGSGHATGISRSDYTRQNMLHKYKIYHGSQEQNLSMGLGLMMDIFTTDANNLLLVPIPIVIQQNNVTISASPPRNIIQSASVTPQNSDLPFDNPTNITAQMESQRSITVKQLNRLNKEIQKLDGETFVVAVEESIENNGNSIDNLLAMIDENIRSETDTEAETNI